MATYIPNTKDEQQSMLREIGYQSFDDLFHDVPKEARVQGELDLPEGKSELEVRRIMEGMAEKNFVFDTILRGAGSYNHYVPAAVNEIADKEEFLTAYTPIRRRSARGSCSRSLNTRP